MLKINSIRKFLNFIKKKPPNLLKSLNFHPNTRLFNFQVKQDFSIFYNTSKTNFAKEDGKCSKKRKELDEHKSKDRNGIVQLNNSVSQEDLAISYENKSKNIVKCVRKDLSEIPSFFEYFKSLSINSRAQKTELSEIAIVTLKEDNIINIAPFDMDYKDNIIKSLKTTMYILNIQQEDNNIVVTVEEIQEKIKMEYSAKIKRIEDCLKEEAEQLKSTAYKEIKELDKSIDLDSFRKLKKQIINTINKEIRIARKEIKMKSDEVNNNNVNIGFFDYDKTNINVDLPFYEIIHSEPDLNEIILKYNIYYLYLQNRDIPFQVIEDSIKSNSENDPKKILISLNNNNGVWKSYFLKILRHKRSLNKYFFLPVVEFSGGNTAPDALLFYILLSINYGFGLNNITIINPNKIDDKKEAIKDICNLLKIIIKEANNEDEKKEACNTLFEKYFILSKNEVFDSELILEKVRGKKAIYFCFDEIGNVKISEGKVLYGSYVTYFKDLPETYDRLIAMNELTILLNNIISTPELGVIVAGKNGLESFMGKDSNFPNEIININLPSLLKEYIKPILKFQLYRNCFLRKCFKRKYPKKCTEEKKNGLNEKMNTLIEKLYEYTAGHPRLLNYTLTKLMNRRQLDLIDYIFMESIKPADRLESIFERYNNEILYRYFLKALDLQTDPYSINVLRNKE